MATYNINTTGSRIYPSTDITASSAVTFSIDNPLDSTSYFTLETVPNSNGFYDTSSQKSTSGSFTSNSGVTTIVSDDYHIAAVVEPGGGELYFIPENHISGSNLQFRGTGADSKIPQFFSRWKTDNTGTSNDNQITLPLVSGQTYDMTINWGDGTSEVVSSSAQGPLTHTYPNSGSYTVYITGDFAGWRFNNGGDKSKLTNISNWGNYLLNTSFSQQFYGCSNLTIDAGDSPIIPLSASMFDLFKGCSQITRIGNWDVRDIINLNQPFMDAPNFNQDIGDWNTTGVTNMAGLFWGASKFNQDIGRWDVSSVPNLYTMFFTATNFNNGGSDSIKNWDVSNITDFRYTFRDSSFNQPIGSWDMSSATTVLQMFLGTPFNQPIGDWDVSNVTDFRFMFWRTPFNQDLGNWDVSGTTSLQSIFISSSFNNGGSDSIKNWDVSNVTDFGFMFSSTPFNQDISGWNVSSGSIFQGMFGYSMLETILYPVLGTFDQNLGSWDMSNATDIRAMFQRCGAFNNGGSDSIRNWNTSKVTSLNGIFQTCSLFNQPLDGWDTSLVTDFSRSFCGATSFDQDLSSWNVESAQTMSHMFEGVTLSTPNYDALLISWASQSLQSGIVFDGGNSKYSTAASASRAHMISNYSWTITDGGQV